MHAPPVGSARHSRSHRSQQAARLGTGGPGLRVLRVRNPLPPRARGKSLRAGGCCTASRLHHGRERLPEGTTPSWHLSGCTTPWTAFPTWSGRRLLRGIASCTSSRRLTPARSSPPPPKRSHLPHVGYLDGRVVLVQTPQNDADFDLDAPGRSRLAAASRHIASNIRRSLAPSLSLPAAHRLPGIAIACASALHLPTPIFEGVAGACLEAAAVASPDEKRGTWSRPSCWPRGTRPATSSPEIQCLVRHHLSACAYPRRIAFVDDVPKTLAGKIRRIELRRAEREGSARAAS